METHIYLSVIPEALVISMLPPAQFGAYLATGTKKRTREQAIYFELADDFQSDYFDLEKAARQCRPHPDGRPKCTVYISIYRVLEHVPLSAIGNLWLATRDGRTLKLDQQKPPEQFAGRHHLYQELCPVHPMVVSTLAPVEFTKFITDPAVSVSVPKICFVELRLHNGGESVHHAAGCDLPYHGMEHLRDCLEELSTRKKVTKTVNRIQSEHVFFRCIQSGFFVGQGEKVLYWPFPSPEEMDRDHHQWWRSAALS